MDTEQLPPRVTSQPFVAPVIAPVAPPVPVGRYILFLLLIGILEGAVTLGVLYYRRSLQSGSSQSSTIALPTKAPSTPQATLIPTTVLVPFKTPTPTPGATPNANLIPTPPVVAGAPQNGYSRITVKTARGSFIIDVASIIMTVDTRSVTMVVDSANDTSCSNFCPTYPLTDYIGKYSGFAAISGTTFCPSDDTACGDKSNAYTSPIYNTRTHTWINNSPANWTNHAMIYKNAGGVAFVPNVSDPTTYTNAKDITAAITGKALVHNGQILVNAASLTDEDKLKTTRSGIGIKPNIVYIVVAQNADVSDMASIMEEITATSAMQLDAGLSPAIRFGDFASKSERALPNAVIFTLH
jgi:hypothetical protein